MSAYWPTADTAPDATPLIVDFARIWRDMPKVVFSRTCKSVDWNSRLERGDPVEVVTKLPLMPGALNEMESCNWGQCRRHNSGGQTGPAFVVLGFELRDELCDRQGLFYRADALAGPPDVFPRFCFHVAAAAKVQCGGI